MPLRTGLEVDYNLGGALWLPARVESAADGVVALVFSLGWGTEVRHELDAAAAARLLAPAGAFTIPLLAGQPVDMLRRLPAAPSFPACEQWLSGAYPRAEAREASALRPASPLTLAPPLSLSFFAVRHC